MMEKRILIAAILSAVFMTWYAQSVLKGPGVVSRRPAASSTNPEVVLSPAPLLTLPVGIEEETIRLESRRIQAEIGRKSAAIRSVILNDFLDASKIGPLRIRNEQPLLSVLSSGATLQWELINHSAASVTFHSRDESQKDYNITYEINSGNSNVDIILTIGDTSSIDEKPIPVFLTTWTKGDKLSDRQNSLELFAAQEDINKKLKYTHLRVPIRAERVVPRGTTVLSLTERYFCQSIRFPDGFTATAIPSREGSIAAQLEPSVGRDGTYRATVYFGPRDYFYLREAGFGKAFPIGMLGQIGLILLSLLNAIAKVVHNHGIAVILFSALVTCAVSPFTMISFRSMKKMQELKPQMDRIMAKHKDKPQEGNKEVFALYREHRVSPLSSCLPMLLQMPIFLALFQAISHYVELRGKEFLWVQDLSLPDRVARLPFSIPLLGSDINLLPILMALAMFVQQRESQKNMPSASTNPSMQLMSGPLMAVMFGVMFYQVPSGLVLYWLTNSLMSLVWYRFAK